MTEAAQEVYFDSIEDALADIAAGKPIIVTDDEDRENEGDLVIAASRATPENINMMIQHARGLICVPCTGPILQRLGVNPMVQQNRESHKTDFTVSVDAAEGITTGISAYDRFRTIQLLGDPNTKPEELVQPGHIFPLKAKSGGVLERAGHTEAAVDLVSLAGLYPAGVICEILNDDGTMARTPELFAFKKRFGLRMISIASLIQYRHQRENHVRLLRSGLVETAFGPFTLKVFHSELDQREHLAFVRGELDGGETLVRVQAENLLADTFHVMEGKAKSGGTVAAALKRIAEEGKGALIYIRREDSGLGQFVSEADSSLGKKPAGMGLREYGIGAQILSNLGLKKIHLLAQTERNLIGLDGYGIEIVGQSAL